MSKRDGGWVLPQIIDPPRKCFTLEIPDEPMHRAAFFGVLESLTYWWNWQRDEEHTAAAVTRVWRDVLERALAGDINCDEGTLQIVNHCREYYPRAPFISFAPTSPFRDEEQVPPGWVSRPWYLPGSIPEGYVFDTLQIWALDLLQFLDSYQPSDVVSFITSLPLTWLSLYEQTGLPRFEIRVEGYGEVEIHLLNVPFGSRVLITVDSPPYEGIIDNVGQFLESLRELRVSETDLDWFSLPPETAQVNIEEVTILEPGEHVIYVTVFPVVNDEFSFFKFGCGLRKVVLCGDNIRPIFPPGREGEGEIIVADPCGCDGLEALVRKIGLSLAYGMNLDLTEADLQDGEIVPGEDDVVIPVPDGYVDQQIAGGKALSLALQFQRAIQDIWDKTNGGADLGSVISVIGIVTYLSLRYGTNEDGIQAWINQVQADGVIYVPDPQQIFGEIFCNRTNIRRGLHIAIFDYYGIGTPETEQLMLAVEMFTDEQLEEWFGYGASQPINNPAVFRCFINDPVTLEIEDGARLVALLNGNSIINIGSIWDGYPLPRKISIRAQGSFTWPDGYVRDLFYKINAHTDNSIEIANYEATYVAGSSLGLGADPPPRYNASHVYDWTVTVENKGNDWIRIWPEESAPREDDAGITGSMTFTFTDLGEA